jgi:NAD(P)-dependent dehydrogenase (short-subunit alcohol dehydrogenase family)
MLKIAYTGMILTGTIMKIGITGHTKGLGHAFFNLFKSQGHEVVGFSRSNGYDIVEKIDDVINAVKDFDMFINNAYAPVAQTELLSRMITEWQGTDKIIVNISSKVVVLDEPPAMVKDYANNKLNQNLLIAKRHTTASPRILNITLGIIDTEMSKPVTAKKMNPADVADMVNALLSYKDVVYVQELMIDVPGQDWKDM